MSDEKKPYIVTAPNIELTDALWQDLLSSAETPDTIPDREVEVANSRDVNPRNTTYWLTEAEAESLRGDPRVDAVTDTTHRAVMRFAFQDGTFNKGTSSSGERQNWGLLRHINTTNTFGTSTVDPGGTYDYVLDGTGVDVVIIDSGIQPNHPEFQDAEGTSRVKEIDWYAASGVSGTLPTGFYTDLDGHGTHVAGVIAGKTFGWAKNADIYSIKLQGLQGTADPNPGISVDDAMDCILGWHNAKTNGRPTILNNSWGFIVYWNVSEEALTYNNINFFAINGGNFRGSNWSGTSKDVNKGHTGQQVAADLYALNQRDAAVDADITLMVNAGIIMVNAAGNGSLKHDIPGGTDYNNYVNANVIGNYFYHRGSSPHIGTNTGFQVGAMGVYFVGNDESKSFYSDAGPAVNIYAAGDRIISAMSDTNQGSTNFDYYLDSNFKQLQQSGTSFAAPQVAGMCALLLQVHPDWTPDQVFKWIDQHAQDELYTTGVDNDFSYNQSTYGGPTKIAYFPLNAQRTYNIQIVP